jgi:molybdopterin molybdotransferase
VKGFDTFIVADWSAAKRAPARPSKDAIWIGIVRDGLAQEPLYFRNRIDAEAWLTGYIADETKAGRRMLATFDFPFGYPSGFARSVTGSDDPLVLWDWFETYVVDHEDGSNNRFELAEQINAMTPGAGPFWGKAHRDRWPGLPYRKEGIVYDRVSEKRCCDHVARASSSCFQMNYPPTVGGQIMMGLPTLSRLRRMPGVAAWPFDDWKNAEIVLAEIWPGLIEPAVKKEMARLGENGIRDREQVRLLCSALSRVDVSELERMMSDLPSDAMEEAWILGAGERETLTRLAGSSVSPPPLRNDCFALPPGVHWTPVDEALALLRARLMPVTGRESVGLDAALGRVAVVDVAARRANPPLPNTAVDGYGFAGGRAPGAHDLPLVAGRAAAGDAPGAVPEGHAIRVLTGAALPDGVDTVILQEDVVVDGDRLRFNGPVKPGANTRKAGEDVAAGDTVMRAGRRITAADLALLAATGVASVEVRVPLRVGVLSTGDELVEAGEPARNGQIFDANRPMLLGLVAQFGHVPVDLGRVADDRSALRTRLDGAAGRVDAILTSGGASAGDEDHVSALLEEAGAMALWRIAVKPGRPLALGLWDGVPVFGLPGNPVAAMICTLIFALPAMRVLAGADWTAPEGYDVPAAFEKRKKAGRREYLRARMRGGRAEVFASEGSGRISGLSWAEGLVELPEEARDIAPGDLVRFIPFGSFGI